ncbi:hypothetical protein [Paenibacillus physcomitrellae]|uniref:Uncharacterized protein n=1 Tax=Paenibacillus physcomitrellae TaxID=1619311 RepID=A0ABQ1FWU5_9BACL|nr:hypothetical protein [Paenibacillus physcomitrellae]GGA32875.1 hypothetical protein GCM10010917_17430 [Paenibacillus physcomitrellae]
MNKKLIGLMLASSFVFAAGLAQKDVHASASRENTGVSSLVGLELNVSQDSGTSLLDGKLQLLNGQYGVAQQSNCQNGSPAADWRDSGLKDGESQVSVLDSNLNVLKDEEDHDSVLDTQLNALKNSEDTDSVLDLGLNVLKDEDQNSAADVNVNVNADVNAYGLKDGASGMTTDDKTADHMTSNDSSEQTSKPVEPSQSVAEYDTNVSIDTENGDSVLDLDLNVLKDEDQNSAADVNVNADVNANGLKDETSGMTSDDKTADHMASNDSSAQTSTPEEPSQTVTESDTNVSNDTENGDVVLDLGIDVLKPEPDHDAVLNTQLNVLKDGADDDALLNLGVDALKNEDQTSASGITLDTQKEEDNAALGRCWIIQTSNPEENENTGLQFEASTPNDDQGIDSLLNANLSVMKDEEDYQSIMDSHLSLLKGEDEDSVLESQLGLLSDSE